MPMQDFVHDMSWEDVMTHLTNIKSYLLRNRQHIENKLKRTDNRVLEKWQS